MSRRPSARWALVALTATATTLSAQTAAPAVRSLSLADAMRLGTATSEALRIARAGVDRAHADQLRARSQMLPQIGATASYVRTLRSQFQGISFGGASRDTVGPSLTMQQVCTPYFLDSTATGVDRSAALSQIETCKSSGFGGIDFGKLGFGAANQYNLGLSASQTLFAGGRVVAQNASAEEGRRSADIALSAEEAQTRLDITEAYYNAALADRLLVIADSSLVQTERVLTQTELARKVGDKSEFDLLRARVARDNQKPVMIQRRSDRDVAYFRIKQLLALPLDDSLELSTSVEDTTVRAVAASPAQGDTTPDARSTVRQASANVRAQEALVRVARAERIPSVTLSSAYGRVAFPDNGIPDWSTFRTNWNVTLAASVPLFTGGRLRGDAVAAQANLAEARARLQQTREFAALDARISESTYRQAEAAWAASEGTAEQAQHAYAIAEVRYKEGISTEVELSDSRLLLQQALANRALAARDLQVARVRMALLRDLPLSTGGGAASGASGSGASASGMPSTSTAGSAAGSTQTGQTGSVVP
jgi:outer membrane protein TolC